jgi:hypothetical protein
VDNNLEQAENDQLKEKINNDLVNYTLLILVLTLLLVFILKYSSSINLRKESLEFERINTELESLEGLETKKIAKIREQKFQRVIRNKERLNLNPKRIDVVYVEAIRRQEEINRLDSIEKKQLDFYKKQEQIERTRSLTLTDLISDNNSEIIKERVQRLEDCVKSNK